MDVLGLIDQAGTCGIFFHSDSDGVCSAVLFNRFVKSLGKKTLLGTGEVDEDYFEKFRAGDVNIFLDLPLDSAPELLKRFKKPVVIDHHPPVRDLNRTGIVHINPRFDKPDAYISTSQVVFDILGKPVKDEWIMRVGAVGDRALKGDENERKASEIIEAVKVIERETGLIKLVRFLTRCESIDEFVNSSYSLLRDEIEREIENQIKKFRIFMEDITFFELESKYNITSILATRLLDMFPDKTIIVFSRKDGFIKISGRSKKYDIGTAFRKAVEGIGRGGGHRVAAAAKIPESEFQRFRKRVLEALRQQSRELSRTDQASSRKLPRSPIS
ncbi:MAG: DHH family phosphoesterase [Candidatus Micrarchaeota archaeon]|nr:DHH family phosphoesterase [Candidatus Micrarchaeota archaeon]